MEVSIQESKRKQEETRRIERVAHGHFELGSRMLGGVTEPSSGTGLSTKVLPDESAGMPLLPALPSSSTNLTEREGELSLVDEPCSARMESSRWCLNELSAVPGRDERAVPILIEEGAVAGRETRCGLAKVTPISPAVVGLFSSGSTVSAAVLEFLRIEPRRRGRCVVCGWCKPLALRFDERPNLLLSEVEA